MSAEEPVSGFWAVILDGALVLFPVIVPPTADRGGAKQLMVRSGGRWSAGQNSEGVLAGGLPGGLTI